ncbi:MAG: archease [Chloroflexi bacterium]|nr:MAG: archease [Chloroflexota bacterium]
MAKFEVLDHTADWALRVNGRNLAELLEQAALGMSSLLVPDLTAVSPTTTRHIHLDAFDAETLLVDWLTELAYLAETEQLVFNQFQLTNVTPTHLDATIRGGRVPELQKHIKAVTYHDLQIIHTDNGLEATIVFDV